MEKILIWKGGSLKMMNIDTNKLQNYYKIYCAKTTNIKNRMFKDFDEFAYIISRVGMEKCLRDFSRKTCNVAKIHHEAKKLLMFGTTEDFRDIDFDNIIPKCSTLEASLRICKNKHIDEIIERK